MQWVADMLLSTEVMTLLVVITHLLLLFPTQFCARLTQTFSLTKPCSTRKDSSTRLKDRQDITPQNPTLALKKPDCHNLLGFKITSFLQRNWRFCGRRRRPAALITFRQPGDNKFIGYGFLEVWHHLYKTWLVIHSS